MATEVEVLETRRISDEELIFAWRLEQLKRAGFDTELAADLAVCVDVDLHAATELVQRGCRPELAALILL